jgi:hypothetical protein
MTRFQRVSDRIRVVDYEIPREKKRSGLHQIWI